MSSHLHVYLGPYVSCIPRPAKKEVSVRVCSNGRCGQMPARTIAKYCEACGAIILDKSRTVDDRVDLADVVGEDVFIDLHSDAHRSNPLFLGSNLLKGVGGRRLLFSSDDDDVHTNVTRLDRDAEIRWFEGHYEDAIAKLRESFDDVEICWGMHLYYM